MRKNAIILILTIFVLGLAACGQTPQPAESPAAAAPSSIPTETSPPPPAILAPSPSPTAEPLPALITPVNAAHLAVSNRLELPFDPSGLVWSLDGKSLAVTGYQNLALFNAADWTVIQQITFPEEQTLLDVSPDGRTMATTIDSQTITLTDILTGRVTLTISPGVRINSASFSPDGSKIVVGSGEEWKALIFDIGTGALLDTVTGFETAAPVYNVRFGADGASLVWTARGSIQVERIEDQALGAHIGHEDFISAYQVAHSGSLLATTAGGTYNGEFTPLVFLWEPESGEKLAELVLPQPAYGLDFSPDDALLAVCAGDNLLIWDVSSQAQLFSTAAHPGGVWAAAFSPDGKALATVGADRSLKLWAIN